MTALDAHGIGLEVPGGWDARIAVRRDGEPEILRSSSGTPVMRAHPRPVVHLANFGLPEERGDFGGGVVELMGDRDVLIVVFEYEPEATSAALFAATGMPRELAPNDLDPSMLRRGLPGQAGFQGFFQEGGRAFCLYVVIGSHAARTRLVALVNTVLAGVRITPAASVA